MDMIEAVRLNKYYGSRHAVKDVTFSVGQGVATGFLGGNGAGKSTTMRMLTGFFPPTSGTVRIGGIDLQANPRAALRLLGYLPESNPLYRDMRVREFLDYRARLKDIARAARPAAIDRSLESCWLRDVEGQIIGQLSKGYRQRVGIADCLLGDPPLLILDEPTVGLDPSQVRQTRALIQDIARERTVFLSTHVLHEVELVCSRVIIIKKGEIVGDGATEDLCRQYDGERYLRLQVNAHEEPFAQLGAVAGVAEVEERQALPGGSFACRLRCNGDLRRELARLAGERGWLVEEMALEPVRLEDIFSRLAV